MSARDDIAAAANTVEGIAVTPTYNQGNTSVGNGFVIRGSAAPDASGFGYIDTWAVHIILGADIKSSELAWDAKGEALLAALGTELSITGVVFGPIEGVPSSSTLSATITGTRAAFTL